VTEEEAADAATLPLLKPLVATLAEATPPVNATTPTAIAANKPYFIAVSLSECCEHPTVAKLTMLGKA